MFRILTVVIIVVSSLQTKAQNYFPLEVGNAWYLNPPYVDMIVGKQLIEGKEYYDYYRSGYDYYYRYDEDGNVIQKEDNSEYVWIKFNIAVGDTFSFKREVSSVYGYFQTVNVEFLSESDTVMTDDTVYTNCLHFYYDDKISSDDEYSIWLAPNVGIVKWVYHAWGGYQLKKAKINGRKIPQSAEPLKVVSTVPFNNSSLVPINTKLQLLFNFMIEPGLLDKSNFAISSQKDGSVSFDIEPYFGYGVYIYPQYNFSYDDNITITISNAIKDYTGDSISDNYLFAFQTEPETPETPFFIADTASTFSKLFYGDFDLGDYDNDGDYDIILMGKQSTNTRYSTLKLFENIDGKYFENSTQFKDLEVFNNDFLKFIDIDNDGLLDIIYNGYSPENNAETLLYKNVNLNFVKQADFSIPFGPATMQWYDYNYDGFKDLAIQGNSRAYTSGISIYDNKNGKLVFNSNISSTGIHGYMIFNWLDFNLDNKMNIAAFDRTYLLNVLSITENVGGEFQTKDYQIEDLKLLQSIYNMDYADYDKDGDIDFIISSTLLRNTGNGFVKDEGQIDLIENAFTKFEDINKDGFVDLYLFGKKELSLDQTSHFIQIYLNEDGIFKLFKEMKSDNIVRTFSARWIDINHDGNTDLVIDSYNGLQIFYNEWKITNTNPTKFPENYSFSLEQNYPNPFNPYTTIRYHIPVVNDRKTNDMCHVTIKVYDVLGRKVITLLNSEQTPGNYVIEFNGSGLSSGIYYYQLIADGFIQTKKMLLLK